ncbi:MerR family transcriptional regulator [Enterococcus quebecensis]|uniref:HTH merR-type domain-containing protein n=1 Tax=Enterococcus quebecensis TaxID=903983 RepID=A0A1E5GSI9_9ENTE|nr:MerR family transcriptional regulator [Enterococcus quebecensis]OEG15671.1 hypothetical protein BCR23_09410 [Enterococcus quebecensis]
MFKIGEFSKLTNLTVRALHHYEELEILLPKEIDTVTNYRYYSADQLAVVNKIKFLQQIGLPLKIIKTIIQSNDMKLLESHYELRETEIHDELEELKKKQNIVKIFKEKMKEGNFMEKYNVELKVMPKRSVMAIRKIVPSFDDEHGLWTDLYEEFMKQNGKMENPPLGVTIYHDKEYKDSDIDIEVQSSIVGNYKDTDDVKFYETSEFTLASVTFNGSYEQMPEVTQAIASWIEANDYVISGPMVNIAHVSPAQDPNPDNWITEAGYMVCTD